MSDHGPRETGQQPGTWATPLWTPSRPAPLPVRPEFQRPAPPPNATVAASPPPSAPPPPAWRPPAPLAPRRPSRTAVVLLGLSTAGIALVLSMAMLWYGIGIVRPWVQSVLTPTQHTPAIREPRARPLPTTPATPTPTPVAPSPKSAVVGASLYPLIVTGSCSRPTKDTTWAAVQTSMRTYADCLDAMWQPVVEAAGAGWTKPTLVFYSDPITKSPCGPSPDKEKAPAHYCPGNQTIYVSDAVTQAVVRYRMLGVEVLAHEYTHHVQELVGILAGARSLGRSDLTTRRVELQAHCVAYVVIMNTSGLAMTTRELDQLRQSWNYSGDPEGHGSAKAQAYWGDRGVNATNLGACDTFSVDEETVT